MAHGATLLRSRSTLDWLARAAEDPVARHPKHLPESLEFREHATLFLSTYHAAPPGTENGFPLVLEAGRLEFPLELTSRSHYQAYHPEGGRFVGTFHVHPPDRAPFFDPQDRVYVLVRANPYLYISAHHVNRNPLLLQEEHARLLRRAGNREPGDPSYDEQYRKATLYWFQQYQLALYEGDPQETLKRTVTPEGRW